MEQYKTILKSGDGQNNRYRTWLSMITVFGMWKCLYIFIDTKVSIFKGTTPAIVVYLFNWLKFVS